MAELLDYIKEEIGRGKSLGQIEAELLENNFPEFTVKRAIRDYRKSIGEPEREPLLKRLFSRKPKKKDKRDVIRDVKHILKDEDADAGLGIASSTVPVRKSPHKEKRMGSLIRIPKLGLKIRKDSKAGSESEKLPIKEEVVKEKPKKDSATEAPPAEPKAGKKPIFTKIRSRIKLKLPDFSKLSKRSVLIGIVIAAVGLAAFGSYLLLGGRISAFGGSAPDIDCATASFSMSDATLSGGRLGFTATNTGDSGLTGFEVIGSSAGSEVSSSRLSSSLPTGDVRSLSVGVRFECGDIDQLVVRSLQCPSNALNRLNVDMVGGCGMQV